MLTQAQAEEVWKLFKDSPLFAGWPGLPAELLERLIAGSPKAGTVLFEPGDPPDWLYLVGQGTIRVTLRRDGGAVWLQQDFGPGQFFGEQALFAEAHRSRAVAMTDATVYCMRASDLRVMIERNPLLYPYLLPEKRAGRLRGIPLLRDLTDAEIRRLARVVEEVTLPANTPVPLDKQPGLWIINHGQVAVTGPAAQPGSSVAGGWPEWRLTAGNFFLTAGVRFGTRCIADSAITRQPTSFFYLPAAHSDRLISAIPEVAQLVIRPLDIAAELARVPLFTARGMEDVHRQHLAQFCGWEFVPARQNITTHGSVGHSFVLLRDGMAIVSTLDELGRLRPRTPLKPGESYGTTSLLEGKPRDATVRAATPPGPAGGAGLRGAEIITLDRRDLQVAFAERRDLWHDGVSLFESFTHVKEEKRLYNWLDEGEVVTWRGRGHILWLVVPELGPISLLILLWILVFKLPSNLRDTLFTFALIITGLVVLFGIWLLTNYLDDYYVITNRRVTRRDRQLALLAETRTEAPIDMVQDVTIDSNIWGRIFDFGDVTIRTAVKIGAIVFAHVANPEGVRGIILAGRGAATAAVRGRQKEILRRGLMGELRLALPVPERERALGAGATIAGPRRWWHRLWPKRSTPSAGQAPLPGAVRGQPPGCLTLLSRPLPEKWRKVLIGTPPPPPQPLPGQVLWRKHPFNLVQRAWAPFLTVLFLLLGGIFGLGRLGKLLQMEGPAIMALWLLSLLFVGLWLWYQVEDYRNDLYVVTDDRVIDIEKAPLGLRYKRREGGLDRVLTVDAVQEGVWAKIFNYGNVFIRTAAADEGYDFIMVPNPNHVQTVVFQKLDAFRRRQEERRAAERQRELIEGLEIYHDLREGR